MSKQTTADATIINYHHSSTNTDSRAQGTPEPHDCPPQTVQNSHIQNNAESLTFVPLSPRGYFADIDANQAQTNVFSTQQSRKRSRSMALPSNKSLPSLEEAGRDAGNTSGVPKIRLQSDADGGTGTAKNSNSDNTDSHSSPVQPLPSMGRKKISFKDRLRQGGGVTGSAKTTAGTAAEGTTSPRTTTFSGGGSEPRPTAAKRPSRASLKSGSSFKKGSPTQPSPKEEAPAADGSGGGARALPTFSYIPMAPGANAAGGGDAEAGSSFGADDEGSARGRSFNTASPRSARSRGGGGSSGGASPAGGSVRKIGSFKDRQRAASGTHTNNAASVSLGSNSGSGGGGGGGGGATAATAGGGFRRQAQAGTNKDRLGPPESLRRLRDTGVISFNTRDDDAETNSTKRCSPPPPPPPEPPVESKATRAATGAVKHSEDFTAFPNREKDDARNAASAPIAAHLRIPSPPPPPAAVATAAVSSGPRAARSATPEPLTEDDDNVSRGRSSGAGGGGGGGSQQPAVSPTTSVGRGNVFTTTDTTAPRARQQQQHHPQQHQQQQHARAGLRHGRTRSDIIVSTGNGMTLDGLGVVRSPSNRSLPSTPLFGSSPTTSASSGATPGGAARGAPDKSRKLFIKVAQRKMQGASPSQGQSPALAQASRAASPAAHLQSTSAQSSATFHTRYHSQIDSEDDPLAASGNSFFGASARRRDRGKMLRRDSAFFLGGSNANLSDAVASLTPTDGNAPLSPGRGGGSGGGSFGTPQHSRTTSAANDIASAFLAALGRSSGISPRRGGGGALNLAATGGSGASVSGTSPGSFTLPAASLGAANNSFNFNNNNINANTANSSSISAQLAAERSDDDGCRTPMETVHNLQAMAATPGDTAMAGTLSSGIQTHNSNDPALRMSAAGNTTNSSVDVSTTDISAGGAKELPPLPPSSGPGARQHQRTWTTGRGDFGLESTGPLAPPNDSSTMAVPSPSAAPHTTAVAPLVTLLGSASEHPLGGSVTGHDALTPSCVPWPSASLPNATASATGGSAAADSSGCGSSSGSNLPPPHQQTTPPSAGISGPPRMTSPLEQSDALMRSLRLSGATPQQLQTLLSTIEASTSGGGSGGAHARTASNKMGTWGAASAAPADGSQEGDGHHTSSATAATGEGLSSAAGAAMSEASVSDGLLRSFLSLLAASKGNRRTSTFSSLRFSMARRHQRPSLPQYDYAAEGKRQKQLEKEEKEKKKRQNKEDARAHAAETAPQTAGESDAHPDVPPLALDATGTPSRRPAGVSSRTPSHDRENEEKDEADDQYSNEETDGDRSERAAAREHKRQQRRERYPSPRQPGGSGLFASGAEVQLPDFELTGRSTIPGASANDTSGTMDVLLDSRTRRYGPGFRAALANGAGGGADGSEAGEENEEVGKKDGRDGKAAATAAASAAKRFSLTSVARQRPGAQVGLWESFEHIFMPRYELFAERESLHATAVKALLGVAPGGGSRAASPRSSMSSPRSSPRITAAAAAARHVDCSSSGNASPPLARTRAATASPTSADTSAAGASKLRLPDATKPFTSAPGSPDTAQLDHGTPTTQDKLSSGAKLTVPPFADGSASALPNDRTDGNPMGTASGADSRGEESRRASAAAALAVAEEMEEEFGGYAFGTVAESYNIEPREAALTHCGGGGAEDAAQASVGAAAENPAPENEEQEGEAGEAVFVDDSDCKVAARLIFSDDDKGVVLLSPEEEFERYGGIRGARRHEGVGERADSEESGDDEEDDGACECSELFISKDSRGMDYSKYNAHSLFHHCTVCGRRPAAFLCLHCLESVCPSHVQAHHEKNAAHCTLFINLLDIMTSFDRIFWCEKCRKFTWKYTEIYDPLVDQIAYTRGTYLTEPVRDIHCIGFEVCLRPDASSDSDSEHHPRDHDDKGNASLDGDISASPLYTSASPLNINSINSKRNVISSGGEAPGNMPASLRTSADLRAYSPRSEDLLEGSRSPRGLLQMRRSTHKEHPVSTVAATAHKTAADEDAVVIGDVGGGQNEEAPASHLTSRPLSHTDLQHHHDDKSPVTDSATIQHHKGRSSTLSSSGSASGSLMEDVLEVGEPISRLRALAASVQGWRATQEDAEAAFMVFIPAYGGSAETEGAASGGGDQMPMAVYCVFDGHGGDAVAKLAALHFEDHLRRTIRARAAAAQASETTDDSKARALLFHLDSESSPRVPTSGGVPRPLVNSPASTALAAPPLLDINAADAPAAAAQQAKSLTTDPATTPVSGSLSGGAGSPHSPTAAMTAAAALAVAESASGGLPAPPQPAPSDAAASVVVPVTKESLKQHEEAEEERLASPRLSPGAATAVAVAASPRSGHPSAGEGATGSASAPQPAPVALAKPATLVSMSGMDLLRGYFASVMEEALLSLDDAIRRTPEGERGDYNCVGCTACVVGVTSNFILCANVGDSGAAFYTPELIHTISVKHRLSDERERQRVVAAGYRIDKDRIEGLLAVPRALGDYDFKQCGGKSAREQAVTAVPDVTVMPVPALAAERWGVVLACDGVWDTATLHQVHFALTNTENDLDVSTSATTACVRARELIRAAMAKASRQQQRSGNNKEEEEGQGGGSPYSPCRRLSAHPDAPSSRRESAAENGEYNRKNGNNSNKDDNEEEGAEGAEDADDVTTGIDPLLLTAAAGVFAQCVAPADNEEGVGLDNVSLIIIEKRTR